MAIIWQDEYNIGIAAIDSQHQGIFSRFNALLDACEKGLQQEELEQLLDYLEGYTLTHFEDEERAMREHDYPALAEHQEQHAIFKDDLQQLRDRVAREGLAPAIILATKAALIKWLITHIRNSDQQFGAFFKQLP